MSALLCLQGGAEFQSACRDIDLAVLARLPGSPRVVVTALAGSVGRDYAKASANGVRWWTELGAPAEAAPDAREEPSAALAVLASADLVVLPGGSPSRLREALRESGVGALLRRRWSSGECALWGASAGAMLLCSHTVLPDRKGQPVVDGLGVLPRSLVLPHWSGRSSWLSGVSKAVPEGTRLLGLPECSGLVIVDDEWTAHGPAATEVVPADLIAPGETRHVPASE